MRRRSERKKSTDVSSPAPARRTNRRRKSQSVSEGDKNVEPTDVNEKDVSDGEGHSDVEKQRESSEERVVGGRRRRSSRGVRTPVKEQKSPAKRRNRREVTPENSIPSIQEEDSSNINNETDPDNTNEADKNEEKSEETSEQELEPKLIPPSLDEAKEEESGEKDDGNEKIVVEEPASSDKAETQDSVQEPKDSCEERNIAPDDEESRSSVKSDKENVLVEDQDDKDEVKLHTRDNSPRSRSNSSERKQVLINSKDIEEGEVVEKDEKFEEKSYANKEDVGDKKEDNKLEEVNHNQDGKTNETSNTTAAADTGRSSSNSTAVISTRKRRWITKKATEIKEPIIISTDSLKTLIADVHPVPLSDVQLESSSDVEDVTSEREEGEQSPSPEPERRRISTDKIEISTKARSQKESSRQNQLVAGAGTVPVPIQRLPSPARNQASCVLYITNLVRPFTVLQLKGLLARTGKIVENGFWIDRIKSKCFVEYETDDEAIETRHALHGVRWPASNPKCLNVDFGSKPEMLKAIESTKEETPKFGHETNKDNVLVGSGWSRERHEEEKRGYRPVREWDVGKKENLDRDSKSIKDITERRRERSNERNRDNSSSNRDNDRNERDRNERDKDRRRRDRENRSSSLSPTNKQKKKEDPPLRLLDDLFRKTKGTPCIYWLPLTPERIAEKESMRLKRLEEQKQRLKQREQEREKERERNRQNDRDRDRDHRRPRSNDRRRSRSRDRRRY